MIRSAVPIVNQKREFTFMEIINRAFRIGECDKQIGVDIASWQFLMGPARHLVRRRDNVCDWGLSGRRLRTLEMT